MKSKNILFSEEARNKLTIGVNQLAKTVAATLGPRGRNVIIESDYESGAMFKLSSLQAKIKFSDKRNIRGRINVR